MSSTAEGYGERINTMKDDISQLERWDGDDREFEDSQEIIQILRRCCIPRNGKGRLTWGLYIPYVYAFFVPTHHTKEFRTIGSWLHAVDGWASGKCFPCNHFSVMVERDETNLVDHFLDQFDYILVREFPSRYLEGQAGQISRYFGSTKEVWFSLPNSSKLTNHVFRQALFGSQAMRLVESINLIL